MILQNCSDEQEGVAQMNQACVMGDTPIKRLKAWPINGFKTIYKLFALLYCYQFIRSFVFKL